MGDAEVMADRKGGKGRAQNIGRTSIHSTLNTHCPRAAGDEHRTGEKSQLSGSFAAAERHTRNRTKK